MSTANEVDDLATSLSVAEYAQMKTAFAEFDTNGDGTISPAELADVLRMAHQNPTKRAIDKMMAEFDVDMDGRISFSEYLKMAISIHVDPADDDAALIESLSVFDKNGDGFISADELRNLLTNFGDAPLTDEELEDMLATFDANGDGRISIDEFVKTTSTLVLTEDGAKLADDDMFAQKRRGARKKAKRAFVLFDTDRSGYIDKKEFQQLTNAMGTTFTDEEVDQAVKEIDTSNDGQISYAEFLKWWVEEDRVQPAKAQSNIAKKNTAVLKTKLHATNFVKQGKELLARLSQEKMKDDTAEPFTSDITLNIGQLVEGQATTTARVNIGQGEDAASEARARAEGAPEGANLVMMTITLKDDADLESLEEWCSTMAKLLFEPLQEASPLDDIPEPVLSVAEVDGQKKLRAYIAMPSSEEDPFGIVAALLSAMDISVVGTAEMNHIPGGDEVDFGARVEAKGNLGQLMGVLSAVMMHPAMQDFDDFDSDDDEFDTYMTDPYMRESSPSKQDLVKAAEVLKALNVKGEFRIRDPASIAESLRSLYKSSGKYDIVHKMMVELLEARNKFAYMREKLHAAFGNAWKEDKMMDEEDQIPQELKDLYYTAVENFVSLECFDLVLGDNVASVVLENFPIFTLLFTEEELDNAPPLPGRDDNDEEDDDEEEEEKKKKRVMSKVERAFKLFDRDDSGSIDRKELRQLAYALGNPMTIGEAQAALESIDTGADGTIELDEFAKWWMSVEDGDEEDGGKKKASVKMRAMKTKLKALNLKKNASTITKKLHEARTALASVSAVSPFQSNVVYEIGNFSGTMSPEDERAGVYVEYMDAAQAIAAGTPVPETVEGVMATFRLEVRENADDLELASFQELLTRVLTLIYCNANDLEDSCPYTEDVEERDLDEDDELEPIPEDAVKVDVVAIEGGGRALEACIRMPPTNDLKKLLELIEVAEPKIKAGLEINTVHGTPAPGTYAANAYVRVEMAHPILALIQQTASVFADPYFYDDEEADVKKAFFTDMANLPETGQVDTVVKMADVTPFKTILLGKLDEDDLAEDSPLDPRDLVERMFDPAAMYSAMTDVSAYAMANVVTAQAPPNVEKMYYQLKATILAIHSMRFQTGSHVLEVSFKNAAIGDILADKEQVDAKIATLKEGEYSD